MSFLDKFENTITSPFHRDWPHTSSDPAIEKLRQEVRQAETENQAPALDRAWKQIQQFRHDNPSKVAEMTKALTDDALLPQLEMEWLDKEGLKRFGSTTQFPVNDHITPQQMQAAQSTDPFESALIAGLQKDFPHYTSDDGSIYRRHVQNDLLNGMVHGPDFYPPMKDRT